MDAEGIIGTIVNWAKEQPTVQAVALVGAYARGMARADSDIDIVVLTTNPQAFRAETAWLKAIGARVWKWRDEDYGQLWSRRPWLAQNGAEIELGFASPSLERRRPVLASWASFVCGKTGDNVVELRRAGRDPSREFSENMEAPRRGRSARGKRA